jgi:hypothetical protein
MKILKIILVVASLISAGCATCEASGDIMAGKETNLPKLRDENSSVEYPFYEQIETELPDQTSEDLLNCKWFAGAKEWAPKEIEEQFIGGVYKEIEFDYEYQFSPDLPEEKKLLDSEYIHVKDVILATVDGDSFQFLDWVTIYPVRRNGEEGATLAWTGRVQDSKVIFMSTDSSVNIREFVNDNNELILRVRLRAKSPSSLTFVVAKVTFAAFYECE